jgi:hypothetical protein
MIASTPPPEKKWVEIGRSTTSSPDNKKRAEVKVDDYYVVVGFEVNNASAFKDDTQDLAIDYGHAFFYVVKNKVIVKLLSFGPGGAGKTGWFNRGSSEAPNGYNTGAFIKDGYQNSRPGDADYPITETVKAFKINLTQKQGTDLVAVTENARKDIKSGKQRYTAYLNDTCAETARDILKKASITTPSGSGKVKHSDIVSFPIAYAVNPYMWHHNFKKEGKTEVTYKPPYASWRPPTGEMDPIFGNSK